MTVFLVTAAGCEATNGTIELRNESADHLLWIKTTPELLAETVRGNQQWATVPPGGMVVQGLSGAVEPDWCEAPAVVGYLLRPLDGQALDRDRWPIQVDLDDFEIVAEQGPGFCWGKKDSVWTFSG